MIISVEHFIERMRDEASDLEADLKSALADPASMVREMDDEAILKIADFLDTEWDPLTAHIWFQQDYGQDDPSVRTWQVEVRRSKDDREVPPGLLMLDLERLLLNYASGLEEEDEEAEGLARFLERSASTLRALHAAKKERHERNRAAALAMHGKPEHDS